MSNENRGLDKMFKYKVFRFLLNRQMKVYEKKKGDI